MGKCKKRILNKSNDDFGMILKRDEVIENIISDIKEQTGEVIDFNKIPLNDKETFELLFYTALAGIVYLYSRHKNFALEQNNEI